MQTNRLAALTINFDPCDVKPIYLEEIENSHYPICYFENKWNKKNKILVIYISRSSHINNVIFTFSAQVIIDILHMNFRLLLQHKI